MESKPVESPMSEGSARALQRLIDGNQRFVDNEARHPDASAERRSQLGACQHPFATLLGCSDSRVPLELLFDQGFGDLFVIRVAGNVIGPNVVASIEYGVAHLGTPLVVVLGHQGCGAVTAALAAEADKDREPAGIRKLLTKIEPALERVDPAANDRLQASIEANVRQSVEQLEAVSELGQALSDRGARILGAIYELDTGHVRWL